MKTSRRPLWLRRRRHQRPQPQRPAAEQEETEEQVATRLGARLAGSYVTCVADNARPRRFQLFLGTQKVLCSSHGHSKCAMMVNVVKPQCSVGTVFEDSVRWLLVGPAMRLAAHQEEAKRVKTKHGMRVRSARGPG